MPAIARLLKDQYNDHLRKLNAVVTRVNVDGITHTANDVQLFDKHGADLSPKSKIPDDEDYRILLYGKQLSTQTTTYVVSGDHVFTKNIPLIKTHYSLIVLAEDTL